MIRDTLLLIPWANLICLLRDSKRHVPNLITSYYILKPQTLLGSRARKQFDHCATICTQTLLKPEIVLVDLDTSFEYLALL